MGVSFGSAFSCAAAAEADALGVVAAGISAPVSVADIVRLPLDVGVVMCRFVLWKILIRAADKALYLHVANGGEMVFTQSTERMLAMRQGLQQVDCVTYALERFCSADRRLPATHCLPKIHYQHGCWVCRRPEPQIETCRVETRLRRDHVHLMNFDLPFPCITLGTRLRKVKYELYLIASSSCRISRAICALKVCLRRLESLARRLGCLLSSLGSSSL